MAASLARSGWLTRLALAAAAAMGSGGAGRSGSEASGGSEGDESRRLDASLERVLRCLVAQGHTRESCRTRAASLLAQLQHVPRSEAAVPRERAARLCQLFSLPAVQGLAEALLAENSRPELQETELLLLGEEAATRQSCAYLLCSNLDAPKKVGHGVLGETEGCDLLGLPKSAVPCMAAASLLLCYRARIARLPTLHHACLPVLRPPVPAGQALQGLPHSALLQPGLRCSGLAGVSTRLPRPPPRVQAAGGAAQHTRLRWH